ncbi:MAG TPA: proton-conducting transporter membrane subunit [Gaiellaceae bacterium]|nr:proton-conducting transporter membrane subunit [Gaiellaceae bacterium]
MTSRELLAVAVALLPAVTAAVAAAAPRRAIGPVAIAGAAVSAAAAVTLAAVTLAAPGTTFETAWLIVDPAAGILVGVIGVVGAASVLVSPSYLRTVDEGLVRHAALPRLYYGLLFAFWAVLAGVPVIGNLGGAWLLVEATTAASALLVGFSGKGRALEAGWKYLILTSLGLGVALLGIVLLAATAGGGLDALSWHQLALIPAGGRTVLVAYLLLLAGLAAKIGWAPVHNWLPDAHSEAPAPVSALLSAALLPAVLLVAWRSSRSLAPVIGAQTARSVLVGFGLVSLAFAVPFLWRPLPWKRLLAYSSLEHMGVVALGVGFGGPVAFAGVAVHIAGHALAKALGFYAAVPLLAHEPHAGGHPAGGVARTQPALAATMGVSLGALAGLPPSPLFLSEVLIVAGGFAAGRPWAAAVAAVLLSLGFLGLAHALLDVLAGRARHASHRGDAVGMRPVAVLTVLTAAILLVLTAAAFFLPGSELAHALAREAP